MPTSDRQGKFIAKALIDNACPSIIWDVGPGEGTYRNLVEGDDPGQSWNIHWWVGVEIWEPYIQQFGLEDKYNEIICGDIREQAFDNQVMLFENPLIIFGDVLEHMPEDDARALILRAKQHFRYILVSIPIVHAPQGEVNGNPYEAHLKHWGFDEMHAAMGYCMAFKGHTIGLYWWDSEEDV